MLKQIHLSRIDLNLLLVFEVVLEQGHVGRAAGMLALTPSAVSHRLNRLRDLLNDPLFLRTPRGVMPTARATELAQPIAEILARVRSVVASAEPFVAAKSARRFTLGAPDAISAVIVPLLLEALRKAAPAVDISVRQVLPPHLGPPGADPWESALHDLEARALDVAILPRADVPARFRSRALYEEDFVIAMRTGHPFARDPTLEGYCRARHLVVSQARDNEGFVDGLLARRGLARRVSLAVPNFMFALAMLGETDLLAALPRSLVVAHAARYGLVFVEAPLPLPRFRTCAIATRSALMDAGVAWIFDTIATLASTASSTRRVKASRHSASGRGAVRAG